MNNIRVYILKEKRNFYVVYKGSPKNWYHRALPAGIFTASSAFALSATNMVSQSRALALSRASSSLMLESLSRSLNNSSYRENCHAERF